MKIRLVCVRKQSMNNINSPLRIFIAILLYVRYNLRLPLVLIVQFLVPLSSQYDFSFLTQPISDMSIDITIIVAPPMLLIDG